MTDVVLYDYWRSSAAYRLRIAMNLAGISYQSISVDLLKGEHKTEAYLNRNPTRIGACVGNRWAFNDPIARYFRISK